MDRTTRIPLMMALIALAGVGLLAGLSKRYGKISEPSRASRPLAGTHPQRPGDAPAPDPATRRAAAPQSDAVVDHRFERFVAVREALRAALEDGSAPGADEPSLAALVELRDRAIHSASWTSAEYRRALRDYRLWKAASAPPDVSAELDPYRARLISAHLGRFESADL